jgi:hypothetical protein
MNAFSNERRLTSERFPKRPCYLLQQVLRAEIRSARLPEFIPNEEVSAPYDLPRSSQPVLILACCGQQRLPDIARSPWGDQ